MEFVSVMRQNKIIVFGSYEQGGNESFLNVLQRIDIFDVEMILRIRLYTFYLIVFDKKVRAIPENADKLLTYFFASSLQRSSKLLKGESSTKHPIS